ncbi:MAG: hypothetical protein WC717_02055 [Candidatus Micrarchaeia archaeon]
MPITEIISKVDLHNIKVRSLSGESSAITGILSQIAGWLDEKELKEPIFSRPDQSIIFNKLVFFSSKEITNQNQDMQISAGWYKYGPCYELGRSFEESLQNMMLPSLRPKKIIEEVETICAREVPLFLKCKPTFKYPYEYLTHVYRELCDIPEIKQFYIAKHELGHAAYLMADNKTENTSDYEKKSVQFEAAVLKKEYDKTVKLDEDIVDTAIDYNIVMEQALMNERLGKQKHFEIVNNFIDVLLPVFACKNYGYTFESPRPKLKEMMPKKMEKNSQLFLRRVKELTEKYYDLVS